MSSFAFCSVSVTIFKRQIVVPVFKLDQAEVCRLY